MGDAPDDLYTLRNLFWMGGFQLAINEANGMRNTAAALLTEKKEYLYRSYLALGQHDILLGEITSESPAGTCAFRESLATILDFPSLVCIF